jgi:hypothetical protein
MSDEDVRLIVERTSSVKEQYQITADRGILSLCFQDDVAGGGGNGRGRGVSLFRGAMATTGDKQEGIAPKRKRATTKERLVSMVIQQIGDKIESNELKGTVGDLVRLIQLEKELKAEKQPREIKVSWVEPEEEHASEQ